MEQRFLEISAYITEILITSKGNIAENIANHTELKVDIIIKITAIMPKLMEFVTKATEFTANITAKIMESISNVAGAGVIAKH